MGKRELVALLKLSSWCLVMVEQLFLTVPRGCLRFVIVVFPDHTHLLFLICIHLLVLWEYWVLTEIGTWLKLVLGGVVVVAISISSS